MLVCALYTPNILSAQALFFGNENPRKTTALSVSYSLVDFSFNGDTAPPVLLNFSEPAYGLTFSRSNIFASFMFGSQSASDTTETDVSLIDFSIFAWSEMFFSADAQSADQRFFVPIMLFSNFRRVSPDSGSGSLEEFNIATIGLGLGVGYYGKFSDTFTFELRSTPGIGYAAQSFGESTGVARIVDTDVQLHFAGLFDRLGISIGYTFRYQDWNINETSIFGNLSQDLYDYKNVHHTASVGVNF